VTVTLNGTAAFRAQVRRAIAARPERVGSALFRVCDGRLMPQMIADTPVDTGALRASGHTQLPVIDGSTVTVTMGFGGPAVDYAIYVHENLEAHHPVGHAKFMERVLLNERAAVPDYLVDELNQGGVL
jgi:hypothetical protein